MSLPKESSRPLRILAVVNLPWDGKLGAARVWIELAREWEQDGHQVERFCLTDAFPSGRNSRLRSAWRQVMFPRKAAAYIRRNRGRFDVIDSLIGCVTSAKASLLFDGLLVARSVGLYRLYDQFLKRAEAAWPPQPKGRWFGPFLHKFLACRTRKDSDRSVSHCDLLNVPNEEEKFELVKDSTVRAPVLVQPYGLTCEFREALAAAALPAPERLARETICFIGMWTPRKGSLDWRTIITRIRRERPRTRFLFLGTMFEDSQVYRDVGLDENIICRRNFTEKELPSLLAECTLGLFPSYIEGFGLAILEQLAAGLPVVAYDVPGPRQILHTQRSLLLVPPGDTNAMSARARNILGSTLKSYSALSQACLEIAQTYRWEEIARRTIEQYRAALSDLAVSRIGA